MMSDLVRQSYNERTDVLTVSLRDVPADVTEDTPSGFIVYYSMPSHELVGLEVSRYCRRFGPAKKKLHVDVDPPFDLPVEAVECGQLPQEDLDPFEKAMRAFKGNRSMFAR